MTIIGKLTLFHLIENTRTDPVKFWLKLKSVIFVSPEFPIHCIKVIDKMFNIIFVIFENCGVTFGHFASLGGLVSSLALKWSFNLNSTPFQDRLFYRWFWTNDRVLFQTQNSSLSRIHRSIIWAFCNIQVKIWVSIFILYQEQLLIIINLRQFPL